MKIVLDCANGAGYKAAPKMIKSLGAKLIVIGNKPNGFNINKNCGSTFPNKLQRFVIKHKAHLGISLDGDADRIIMCDEKGSIIDGDQIIAALALQWKKKKILKGGVVGTLMSNYGLEKFFQDAKKYGCDGVIIPDLSIEDAAPYIKAAKKSNIPIIFLISPLCSEHRLKKITKASEGFVYLLSSKGVTGVRSNISGELSKVAANIKKVKNIPIAVGFGISSREHVKTVHKFADGAIIGSFFVNIIEENIKQPKKAIELVCSKIKEFNQS